MEENDTNGVAGEEKDKEVQQHSIRTPHDRSYNSEVSSAISLLPTQQRQKFPTQRTRETTSGRGEKVEAMNCEAANCKL